MAEQLRADLELLLADASAAWSLPRDRATALLAFLAGAQTVLQARVQSSETRQRIEATPDRGLSAEAAAELLGPDVTADWLRRYGRSLPFARRLSREKLLFSEQGIQRFLAAGLSAVRPSSPRAATGSDRRATP